MRNRYRICFGVIVILIGLSACGKVTQEVAEEEKKEVKTFDLLFKLEVFRPDDLRFDPTSVLHKDEMHVNKARSIILDDELQLTVVVQGITKNQGFTNLSWGTISLIEEDPKQEKEVSTLSKVLDEKRVTENAEVSTENAEVPTENVVTKPSNVTFEQIAKNQHQLSIKASNYNDTYIKLMSKVTENKLDKYRLDVKSVKIRYDYDAYFIKVFENKDTYRLFSITKKTAEDNQSYTIGEITEYQTFINVLYLQTLQKNDFILEESIVASYDMYNRLYPPEFFESLTTFNFPKNTVDKFDNRLPQFRFKDSLIKELIKIMEVMLTVSKEDAKTYIKNHKNLALSKVSKRMIMSRIDAFILPEQKAQESDEDESSDTPTGVTENASVQGDA